MNPQRRPYLEIVIPGDTIDTGSGWFFVESTYRIRFDGVFRVELRRRVTEEQYITVPDAEEYYRRNFPEYPLGNRVTEYERPTAALNYIRDSNEVGISGRVSLKDQQGESLFTLEMKRGDYEDELLGLINTISRVVISD